MACKAKTYRIKWLNERAIGEWAEIGIERSDVREYDKICINTTLKYLMEAEL